MNKKKAILIIQSFTLLSLLLLSQNSLASNEKMKCAESFGRTRASSSSSHSPTTKLTQISLSDAFIQQAIFQYKYLVLQVTLLKQGSSASSSSIAALNSEIASRKRSLLNAGVSEKALVLTREDRAILAEAVRKQTSDAQERDARFDSQTQSIAQDSGLKEWELDKTFEKTSGYSRDISKDGRFMATDDLIQELLTGKEVRLEKIDGERIEAVKFSPDGIYIAGISEAGWVHLYEANSGKHVRKFYRVPSRYYWLKFSQDSRILFAIWEGGAYPVEVSSGRPMANINKRWESELAFSPDGLTAAVSEENIVKILNAVTGEEIGELIGHTKSIAGLAFSKDGKTIATGSRDDTVRLWDVSTQKQNDIFTDVAITYNLSLAFSSKGNRLIVAEYMNSIREYDLSTRQEKILYVDKNMALTDLVLSDDDEILYATERLGPFGRLWHFVTRRWKLKSILK